MANLTIDIGGKSNNSQIYSGNTNSSIKDINEIVGQFNKISKNDNVIIRGGEPTINPAFFEIIDMITKIPLKSVVFVTNGRLFSYAETSEKIPKQDNISFYVELLGHTKEQHESQTKTAKSFEQTLKGIENLIKNGISTKILIPVREENVNHLNEIINLASEYNVCGIILYLPQARQNEEKKSIFLIDKNLKLIEAQINEIYKKRPFLFEFVNFPLKFALKYSPIISNLEIYSYINNSESIRIKMLDAVQCFNEKSAIAASIDDVYEVLREVKNENSILPLAERIGFPIPSLVLLFDELKKKGIVEIEKDKIKTKVTFEENKLPVADFSRHRLLSDPKVCQLTVMQKSVKERVEYIERTCRGGGNIAILGDDDFMSLSIASKGIFDRIVVFEIDKRIVETINSIAKKNNLNVHVVNHDLRNELPKEYYGKFDAFYTDTPYSLYGFILFISRGINLLKKEQKRHGFASFSPELPVLEGVELPVQNAISEMGLFIERKTCGALNDMPPYLKTKFNDFKKLYDTLYIDNKNLTKLDEWFLAALGRKEFLFHFLSTEKTKPLITSKYNGEIYYDREPLHFYTDQKLIQDIKMARPSMNFMIYTTERCNLACKYCDTVTDRNRLVQDITYKPKELINFLKKAPNPWLYFYGGEPLLNPNLIQEIVSNVPASNISLQTNGLLLDVLDKETINKIHVISVSLDGPEDITDKCRGKGVYKKAISQVKKLCKEGYDGVVNVRMTISPDTDIYKSVTHFINSSEFKFDSIHWQLNAMFHSDDDWHSNRNKVIKWFDESYNPGITSLIRLWIDEIIRNNKVIQIVPFMGIMHSMLTGIRANNVRCGAGWCMWTINTVGNIFPCPVMRLFPEFKIGNIIEMSPADIQPTFSLKEPCTKCEVFELCGGRCLCANLKNEWDDEGYKIVCGSVKHLINELKKAYPLVEKLLAEKKISIDDFKAFQDYEVIP